VGNARRECVIRQAGEGGDCCFAGGLVGGGGVDEDGDGDAAAVGQGDQADILGGVGLAVAGTGRAGLVRDHGAGGRPPLSRLGPVPTFTNSSSSRLALAADRPARPRAIFSSSATIAAGVALLSTLPPAISRSLKRIEIPLTPRARIRASTTGGPPISAIALDETVETAAPFAKVVDLGGEHVVVQTDDAAFEQKALELISQVREMFLYAYRTNR
jgi:hypothetical protein